MNRMIIGLALTPLAVVPACGGAEESSDTAEARGEEQAATAEQSFTVWLDPATTAESVIPQIVAAARGPLAAVCEEHSGVSVRIVHPLASGWVDVSCASALAGDGATGEASAALVSDEEDGPVGEARQPFFSPIGATCTLLGLGLTAVTAYGCERNYPHSRECPWLSTVGSWAIPIAVCSLF
jgi:hypothetical protein